MYVYSLKQNSLQGESQGQRSLAGLGLIRGAYSPWGRKELDMTEATACMQAHTHTHTHTHIWKERWLICWCMYVLCCKNTIKPLLLLSVKKLTFRKKSTLLTHFVKTWCFRQWQPRDADFTCVLKYNSVLRSLSPYLPSLFALPSCPSPPQPTSLQNELGVCHSGKAEAMCYSSTSEFPQLEMQ